jgi:hypothetical protein
MYTNFLPEKVDVIEKKPFNLFVTLKTFSKAEFYQKHVLSFRTVPLYNFTVQFYFFPIFLKIACFPIGPLA